MKAEQRKEQILGAALKAFAKHGYERTSIAVICQKAGIARPTLYQYFKDKRSLFRELLEGYMLNLHEKIHARQRAKDAEKVLSEWETHQSIHQELMEEFSQNRDFFIIFFKEAKARNAETEDIVNSITQEMVQQFVREMRAHPRSKGFSDEDLEFTVLYMVGGMMQTVEYYLFGKKPKLSLRELADKVSRIEARIAGQ